LSLHSIASDAKPEVGVITSWRISPNPDADSIPPGLHDALQEGVNLLDLYFLDHNDIAWYARQAEWELTLEQKRSPQAFVAALDKESIRKIAGALNRELTASYEGRLVGWRPRFAALATHFSYVSLTDMDDTQNVLRKQAVCALMNTLYLAYCLGTRWVEIVGGMGVPRSAMSAPENTPPAEEIAITEQAYRELRCAALATSLHELYDHTNIEHPLYGEEEDNWPYVVMELEPGASLLMNDIKWFVALREQIAMKYQQSSLAYRRLYLNVDVAHAFLLGLTPERLNQSEMRDLTGQPCVAHMHLSDHSGDCNRGGLHASDVIPGTFHFYRDYEPWLKFAIEQTRSNAAFSGVIAIELEACNEPEEMLDALYTVRRWVRRTHVAPSVSREHLDGQSLGTTPNMKEGGLMVVDIGGSTSTLLEQGETEQGCLTLEEMIGGLCREVQDCGGSVMSFTGDGMIALFEDRHFGSRADLISSVIVATDRIAALVHTKRQDPNYKALTVRIALHWGRAYIPSSGRLRDQIIGGEVVRAARVCDWLGHVIEPAQPPELRSVLIGTTKAFKQHLDNWSKPSAGHWTRHSNVILKGLRRQETVYWRHAAADQLPLIDPD
jgi:class 3 adenylate cyclase